MNKNNSSRGPSQNNNNITNLKDIVACFKSFAKICNVEPTSQ